MRVALLRNTADMNSSVSPLLTESGCTHIKVKVKTPLSKITVY
jgi:hypothetical protein